MTWCEFTGLAPTVRGYTFADLKLCPCIGCRRELTEPLVHSAGHEESTQPTEQPNQPTAPDATALPSQTGTIKILALVLVVVALLVTVAALVSKSGVVQIGGPPPECRKSASLAVLRQQQAAQSSSAGLLQLIVWGGKGKKAGLVFDNSHVLNLQDRKWHSVHQRAGLLLSSLRTLPRLRNIWKSSASQQLLQTDPARLPTGRWKQLSVTDPSSSSMVIFGGDGLNTDQNSFTSRHDYLTDTSAGYDASSNGHNYFNDAWQVKLIRGKARWQQLWNTEPNGNALRAAVHVHCIADCVSPVCITLHSSEIATVAINSFAARCGCLTWLVCDGSCHCAAAVCTTAAFHCKQLNKSDHGVTACIPAQWGTSCWQLQG